MASTVLGKSFRDTGRAGQVALAREGSLEARPGPPIGAPHLLAFGVLESGHRPRSSDTLRAMRTAFGAFARGIVAVTVLMSTVGAGPELQVLMSGGFAAAYRDALPAFERTTGIAVHTATGASQGSGPNTIAAQLRRGTPADVVIMSKEGLEELAQERRIVPDSRVDLAQTLLGLAVHQGAPRPNIGTVDAFKATLLRAKSITFPMSTTGIYMTTKMFPQLGIADEMTKKYVAGSVAAVAAGDAELAIQPVSELLHVQGTEFVGTVPADIQYVSVFSAAVVAGTTQLDAAKRLLAFLTSDQGAAAMRNAGMEPLHRAR